MGVVEDCKLELQDAALRSGGLRYNLFEPGNVPGFGKSNIAKKLGRPAEETDALLRAVDLLEDQAHLTVSQPRLVHDATVSHADNTVVTPAYYEVVIEAR